MRIELTLVPSLQIRPWEYSAGKYVWDHFWQSEHENQRKGRGGTVNSMSDYVEAVIWRCYTEVYLECSRTSIWIFYVLLNKECRKCSWKFQQSLWRLFVKKIFLNPIHYVGGWGGGGGGGGWRHIVPAADSFVCCGSIRDFEKVRFSENS